MRIDGDVSDLFFNLDFEDLKIYHRNGGFLHFDEGKLRDRAQWFSNAIYRVSGRLWSVDDILRDFRARV